MDRSARFSTPSAPRPAPRALSSRDHGVALVGRITRWLTVGAVGASGAVSLAAEHASQHHAGARSAPAAVGPAVQPSSASSGDGGSSLQQPAQAPAPAPAAPSAPVVSGGS